MYVYVHMGTAVGMNLLKTSAAGVHVSVPSDVLEKKDNVTNERVYVLQKPD